MKKTFIFVTALISAVQLFSQNMMFHQGYMVVDGKATIFASMDYKMVVQDSLLYLPHETIKIDSTSKINGQLVMYLHDGSIAQYYDDEVAAGVFCLNWKNGRLVFWQNRLAAFEVDVNK